MPSESSPTAEHHCVEVDFEYSTRLPHLLDELELSVLLSTYQAGRVVSISSHDGEVRLGFAHFDQAMGLTRTPTGIAVGIRDTIWCLPANREIASQIKPAGKYDIAFLARTAHRTGPLMGHELAWANDRLWLVNTLFNGLVTIGGNWSFVPQWKPTFIGDWAPGDRCHLNGLAVAEDDSGPAYVTALGESDTESGWRDNKVNGGCLIHVPSGEVVMRGLAMPHSPRLYGGKLYVLNSGHGSLISVDPVSGSYEEIAILNGFLRGLDFYGGYAFIGLSQIRDKGVFGGLPLESRNKSLRCGLAVVNLSNGSVDGTLWFHSGVEEVFSILTLPGWHNPVLMGPNTTTDGAQNVWLVPP